MSAFKEQESRRGLKHQIGRLGVGLALAVAGINDGTTPQHIEAQTFPTTRYSAEGPVYPQWPVKGVDIVYLPRLSDSENIDVLPLPEVKKGETLLLLTGDYEITDASGNIESYRTEGKGASVIAVLGADTAKQFTIKARGKYMSVWKVRNPNAVSPTIDGGNLDRVVNFAIDDSRAVPSNQTIMVPVISRETGNLVSVTKVLPGQKLLEGPGTRIALSLAPQNSSLK